jgi:ElaB/YqjD/DUF883 family membrane-anchored ribosome-binding protein
MNREHNGDELKSDSDDSLEELRVEAEIQRERVAQDLSTLSRKVSPENVKLEAKQAVKQAGQSAAASVREGVDGMTQASRRIGSGALDVVRDNPVPVAMIGLGLGMLLYSSRRRDGHEPSRIGMRPASGMRGLSSNLKHAAIERRDEVRGHVGEWSEAATDYTRHVGRRAASFYEENPLAVAAATFTAGAALGLMLPGTRTEDAVLGKPRDALREKVRDYAEKGLDAAHEAASKTTQKAAARLEHQAHGE